MKSTHRTTTPANPERLSTVNSNEYIKGAIRTESGRFDSQNVDADTLKTVFKLVIAAGQAADALKRALYYGKPLNDQKLHDAMKLAKNATHDYDHPIPLDLKGYSSAPAVNPRIVHAAVGLVTESAEIVEKVLKSFEEGSDFDYANLFEELSDINWYQALAIDAASHEDNLSTENWTPQEVDCGKDKLRKWSFESIWEKNLAKLKARYPNQFETDKAYNRDLENEKKALGE